MWIILFYILPVILGILTTRKFNKYGTKHEETALSGTPALIVFIVCILPIINVIALIVIWIIVIIDSFEEESDFINIKWLNKLFGTKD